MHIHVVMHSVCVMLDNIFLVVTRQYWCLFLIDASGNGRLTLHVDNLVFNLTVRYADFM